MLHPKGGSYALAVLASPALLSMLFVSGCASVWLYAILVEEQVWIPTAQSRIPCCG